MENTQPQTQPQSTPLQKLNGKNIFVFDTETTGLPDRGPSGWGSYWSYNINDKYENARIVSIAWSALHNYNKELAHMNNCPQRATFSIIVMCLPFLINMDHVNFM